MGSQDNSSHQIQVLPFYLHRKVGCLALFTKTIQTSILSENFPEQNFTIKGYQLAPKIKLLVFQNTSWDFFYGAK
jgi:hypothetical protein